MGSAQPESGFSHATFGIPLIAEQGVAGYDGAESRAITVADRVVQEDRGIETMSKNEFMVSSREKAMPALEINIEFESGNANEGGPMIQVLLVESNPIFLHIVMLLLQEHYGNHVTVVGVADDDRDALTKAQHLQPHVVLLDFMPNLINRDIIPRLRSMLPRVQIIALGLFNTHRSREAALAAGADEFIPKPLLSSQLLCALQTWGGRR